MDKPIRAKDVSIMAVSAALYAVFFFLSDMVTMPSFTLLYLPIILLAVFPLWFGWSGLVGCLIGVILEEFSLKVYLYTLRGQSLLRLF